MAVQAGAVWLPVLPDMSKWNTTMRAGMNITSMSRTGDEAGRTFSSSMLRAVRGGMSPLSAEVGAQARAAAEAAAAAVAAESKKVAAARASEETAAGKVRVAELKLQEVRAKENATASQIAAAEERLAAAQRSQSAAADVAASADSRLSAAQQRAAATSTEMGAASATAGGRFSTMAGRVGSGATSMGSKIGKFAKGAAALGGVFAGFEAVKFAGESIKAAQEFQQGSNVLVTAAGESTKNLGMVRKGLLDISSNTGTSLSQMTEGMYTVEKAGYRGAAGLKIMDAAAKGAKDEGADLGVVTNGLTTMMNLYGKQLGNPSRAMNALMVAAGHSKTTLQEFTNSLGNVLPVGSKAGLSFNEIAGALGTMTSQGMSARRASMNLNKVIISLSNPTKVMSEEMQSFGLNSADVMSNLGKRGLTGTLELMSNTIKAKMGPALVSASKTLQTMPTKEQGWWASLQHGTMTLTQFNNKVTNAKDLTQGQKDAIKGAVPASQGYLQAMTKMTGGNTGLAVSMMLTGSAAKGFKSRTEEVGHAMNSTKDFTDKWGMSSKTTANSLAIAKQTMHNVGVELATKLLPSIASMARGFANAVNWITKFTGKNWSWLGPTTKALGALTAGLVAFSIVNSITKWIKGWTIAQEGLNAALKANMIGIIVVAVITLVAGLVLAYQKVGWFHDMVNKAWAGIKAGTKVVVDWFVSDVWPVLVSGFQTASKWATWLWKNAIVPAWSGIKTAVKAVADWFMADVWPNLIAGFRKAGAIASWLWKNAIEPAWNGIKKATSVWWDSEKYIFGLFYDFITKWIWPIIDFLWHNVWEPAFQGIANVVKWWWNTVTWPLLKLVWSVFKNYIAPIIIWLWHTIWEPAFQGLGSSVSWLWKSVLSPTFSWIGGKIRDTWNNIIHPALDAFRAFIHNGIGPAISWLWNNVASPMFQKIGSGGYNMYHKVLKPTFDALKSAVKAVGTAFSDVKTSIGRSWSGLQSKITGPVVAVVNWIGSHFINPINSMLSKVGLGGIKIPWPHLSSGGSAPVGHGGGHVPGAQYATGGVLPGYSPGRDNMHFFSPQHGSLSLSGGEAVMRPEWTQAVGARFVNLMNAAARSGGVSGVRKALGLASGGVVPSRAFMWGGILDPIKNIGGDIWSGVQKVGGYALDMAKFAADPVGALKRLGGNLLHGITGSMWGQILKNEALKAVGGLGKQALGSLGFGGGGGPTSGPAGSGVQRWAPTISRALGMNGVSPTAAHVQAWLKQVQTESGGNQNAIQGNIGDINNRTGDLAKGLLQTISTTFAAYHFPGHNNIFNGFDNALAAINYAKHVYGDPGMFGVIGHGHGYSRGGVVPFSGVFDQGGTLAPGPNLVQNNLGRPERLVRADDPRQMVIHGDIHLHDLETVRNVEDLMERIGVATLQAQGVTR